MEGPYNKRKKADELLSWALKYNHKKCDIVLGTRKLNLTPYYSQTITNLLKINHWVLFFVFNDEFFILENVALNTVFNLNIDRVESDKGYYIRKSKEGCEIIRHNHLVRFISMDSFDPRLKKVRYIQSINLNIKKLIEVCLNYLESDYAFLGRNCQTFSRYINYNLSGGNISKVALIELNIDGYSYLLLLGVILLLIVSVRMIK